MHTSIMAQSQRGRTAQRLWRIIGMMFLLTALAIANIFMVNLPAAKAMASTPPPSAKGQSERPDWSASRVKRMAARAIETDRDKEDMRSRRKRLGIQLASLGREEQHSFSGTKPAFGQSVRWAASASCLNPTLRRIVSEVAAHYGPVTVNSTCRSTARNAAVGGARHSHHLSGNAADFRVNGKGGAAHANLGAHGSVGGLKHYGGGLFHIDVGPRRPW